MTSTEAGYRRIEERVVAWAAGNPEIRAAFVVGSRARTDHPADEWSDLDLVVFATDPERYLSRIDWLDEIGTVWLSFLESTATGGGRERRVLFDGGLDVDFPIFGVDRADDLMRDPMSAAVVRRGMRVLIDKDGICDAILARAATPAPPAQPPTVAEFVQAVHDFWYHAVWAAKKLRRGELMMAKSCCDSYLKRLLIDLLRCQARARHGWAHETWHAHRFLEEWADPDAVRALRHAYARYDAEETWRALLMTMDLFREVTRDVAARLGFEYPAAADERATECVHALFDERAEGG